MEPDRYQQNKFLFIFGILALLLCLIGAFYSLYLIPYILWGYHYSIPSLFINVKAMINDIFNLGDYDSKLITYFILVAITIISGIISFFISNRIDSTLLQPDLTTEGDEHVESSPELMTEEQLRIRTNEQINEFIKSQQPESSLGFGAKLFLLMLGVVALLFLVELIIKF